MYFGHVVNLNGFWYIQLDKILFLTTEIYTPASDRHLMITFILIIFV